MHSQHGPHIVLAMGLLRDLQRFPISGHTIAPPDLASSCTQSTSASWARNLTLVANTSLSGQRVVRELDAVAADRSYPDAVVSDNGTERTSMASLAWAQKHGVAWHYISPGKRQNAYV